MGQCQQGQYKLLVLSMQAPSCGQRPNWTMAGCHGVAHCLGTGFGIQNATDTTVIPTPIFVGMRSLLVSCKKTGSVFLLPQLGCLKGRQLAPRNGSILTPRFYHGSPFLVAVSGWCFARKRALQRPQTQRAPEAWMAGGPSDVSEARSLVSPGPEVGISRQPTRQQLSPPFWGA